MRTALAGIPGQRFFIPFAMTRAAVLTFLILAVLILPAHVHALTRNLKAAVIKNETGDVVGFASLGKERVLGIYDKNGRGKGFIRSGQTDKKIPTEPGDRYYLMPGKLPLNTDSRQGEDLTFLK
jgi:hypothetical protein